MILVPDVNLWQPGATEFTELTQYCDIKLNNRSIPVGSFIHYAIPAENKMTIIFNRATHVSGVYSYKKNDIVRIIVVLIEIAYIL